MTPLYPEPQRRDNYGLPNARCLNVYYEKTPQGPGEYALLSRPGLDRKLRMGTGPIKGMFRSPGVLNNNIFFVSGSNLYRRAQATGAVRVTGGYTEDRVRFAASTDQLVVVGGAVKAYDGETVDNVGDLSSYNISDVAHVSGRFYYLEKFSATIRFSELGDATDVPALNFFTVDSQPDNVVRMIDLDGEMIFFGRKSGEIWSQTSNPDSPLETAPGRGFDKGLMAEDSLVKIDNSAMFVGHDGIVYRLAASPQRVSNHWIEELIRSCRTPRDITAYELIWDGHTFYAMNIPKAGTFLFDVGERKWTQWQAGELPDLGIRCGICFDGENWLGDAVLGEIWSLKIDQFIDSGEPGGTGSKSRPKSIQRVVSTALPVPYGRPRCDLVALHCVSGQGQGQGEGVIPYVEMAYSDDKGNTWSSWKQEALGRKGAFTTLPSWRRLGRMRSPGRGFEFRTSAPVKVAFYYAEINPQDNRP